MTAKVFKILSEFGVSPVTIEYFGNIYDIYLDGKVWTHNGKRFLPSHSNGNGYLGVNLYNSENKQSKRFYVHRLVAQCYIPNDLNLPDVNHKDFDKSNNIVYNLEWSSRLDNVQHAIAGDRYSGRVKQEINIRNDWVGEIKGTRKITKILDRQAKSGNFYVEVVCLLCGNTDLTMCRNDFLKGKSKSCRLCKSRGGG